VAPGAKSANAIYDCLVYFVSHHITLAHIWTECCNNEAKTGNSIFQIMT